MTFESLYVNPTGRTGRGDYVGALITLLAVYAFYVFLVHAGRNGEWVRTVLLFPAFVLVARRLHDMGRSAWLLAVPAVPILAAVYLFLFDPTASYLPVVGGVALALGLGFTLWGLIGKSQAEANRFGAPAAA